VLPLLGTCPILLAKTPPDFIDKKIVKKSISRTKAAHGNKNEI
jgi:hypothetical protein